MGAGASTLPPEDKVVIAKAMQEKYNDFQNSHNQMNPDDEIQLFETLKCTYKEKLQEKNKAPLSTLPPSEAVSDGSADASHKAEVSPAPKLRAEKSFRSPGGRKTVVQGVAFDEHHDEETTEFGLHPSAMQSINSSESQKTISKIEGPAKLLRAKTSAQLLSMVTETAIDDQEKISNFISLLKSGEMQTKGNEFRQRRLTYSQHTVSDDGTPSAGQQPSPVKTAPKPARSRTTIFASSEIGVVQEKKAPFPTNILGTYSCHGIEPSDEEEDGIHAKINQDRGCIVYPYNNKRNEALFMVLDGHGEQGDKVSEFVMRQIVVSLEKDPLLDTDPIQALKNAYVTTNAALLITDIQSMTSGCTCVTIYCRGNTLYVANAGDSRAVMAHKDPAGGHALLAKNLTRDHKPDDPEERDRIIAAGGFVCPPHEEGLSARVYLDPEFTMIGLAMSRSVGDHAVKRVGVTAEPEVLVFEVQPEDEYLIMASDGVWEFISSQEAVEIVQSCLEEEEVPEACQELIEEAASRWQEEEGDYRDDITAIVVRFPLPFVSEMSRMASANMDELKN